jgi:hypothetical protein
MDPQLGRVWLCLQDGEMWLARGGCDYGAVIYDMTSGDP